MGEIPGNSDLLIIPVVLIQSILLFLSLFLVLCYLSLPRILEFLIQIVESAESKNNKRKSFIRKRGKTRRDSGEHSKKQRKSNMSNEGLKKPEQESDKVERTASTPAITPRPTILNGTTKSTKQFISILYNMMMVVMKNYVDKNRNVALLRPEVPLEMILEYLNPKSFLALSSSCRLLRERCLSAKIKIPQEMTVNVYSGLRGIPEFETAIFSRNLFKEHLKIIQRLPFIFILDVNLSGFRMSIGYWDAVKTFLSNFKNIKVSYMTTEFKGFNDWHGTLQFIRNHGVDRVSILEPVGPENVLHDLMSLELSRLDIKGRPRIGSFASVRSGNLSVAETSYSFNEIKRLITNWMDGVVQIGYSWTITTSVPIENEMEVYINEQYTYVGWSHEGPLPSARPLMIRENDGHNLLTEDGRMLYIRYGRWRNEDECDVILENWSPSNISEILAEFF